ncbi:MAG TPA: hypothetical protein VFA06_09590, partial [Actinocrinis sp.]|uniref:hypothetical protein n=1 Tax=Actinocrinis sp. TaxID=1920516 RepID=UPI002D74ACCB
TELPVSQLIGGSEPCPGGELAVDEASLGDALGCALFTGGRAARRVLRHESFTAYLAARHLVHRGVPEAQLRGVLLSSSRTGAKVHPMLRETAAWLVALDPVAHRWLAQADAETVASYPYAIAQDEVKASLIDGLLDLADADLLRNRSLSDLWIGQLTHPGLVDQLRAALRVGSAERGRAAAVIAQETGETRLVDDLVAVALDPARQTALRVRAVLSANALDHGRAAKMLRPLMTDTPHELDDELRGAVLDALWPQALGVEELVAAMTRETRPTVLDLYALFRLRLPERLSDADLPIVLAWAAARPGHRDGRPQHTGARRDDQLLNRLITRAWSARDRAPLLPALADLVHEQLLNDLHYEVAPPLQCSTDTDERDRRALARLLAERAASLNDAARLAHAPLARALGLLQPADLDWLLDRESQADETDAPRWHVLIRAIFSPADPGHRHSAESRRGSRVWQQVLGPMLDARTAPPAIPAHRVDDRRHAANGQPPLDRAAARQQNLTTLQALLQKTETGDPDGFWRLCWLMQADPDTAVILTWWSDDVTARPGYRALAEQHPDLLDRLIEAADAYLRVQHPHTDDWIDATNVTSWPAQAGYLAFALMDRHAPERLHSLEPAVWHRWAPALLGFGAAADNAGEPERKRRLLSLLGQRAPSAISQPAVRLLRAAASGPAADELRFTTACWSSELADALAAELPGLRAAPNLANFDLALRLLLEQVHAATRLYALQAVRDDATQRDEQAGRHAALGLLYTQPAAAWPEIFTQMRSRPAWGRALAEDIATSYEPFDPLSELDDVQLGALYGWLLEQFPPEQDIWPTEVGFRTAQHDTRFWRERGLKHLTARGTLSAIDALSVLALGNPHRPWLRRALAEAQENHRATCWNPISLRELRALIKDARRRHLRDSGDLLEAVMAELARLQQNMRGTTPEAGFLWDEQRATNAASRWFPKREADLSDYVAKHLRAHLPAVFTNREVEITRAAVGVGERVDLLCQATTMDPSGAATCQIVIEVKGCWNEHLLTGLHDQLAADYMATTGTRHGIYLVGWYPKDQWDRADSRRSKAPSGTAGHLHDELEQRAALEREESQLEIHVIVLDLRRHERAARTRATSRDRQTKSA